MTETLVVYLPGMYGDHHVVRVRQILTGLPGVAEVQASAAQRQATIQYDSGQASAEALAQALAAAGYPPGEAQFEPVPMREAGELRHVAAADQAETVPEAKYHA